MPKLTRIKGTIVNRKKLEEVPTGYIDLEVGHDLQ